MSDLLLKDDKYIFKAINSCSVGGIYSLQIRIDGNKADNFIYCTSKINYKFAFKTEFLVHNNHLNMCWKVQRIGVKCVKHIFYAILDQNILFKFKTFCKKKCV